MPVPSHKVYGKPPSPKKDPLRKWIHQYLKKKDPFQPFILRNKVSLFNMI